jgi:hypothetical protein
VQIGSELVLEKEEEEENNYYEVSENILALFCAR